MLVLHARPASISGAHAYSCWREHCVNAPRSSKHVNSRVHLRRALARSSIFLSSKRTRTSTSLSGGADLQLQLPADVDSTAPPDIFQSALNALSLGAPTESYDAGYDELHDDISLEQGQAAAQVGKAVYEVRLDHADMISRSCMYSYKVQPVMGFSRSCNTLDCRFSSCQPVAKRAGFM